MPGVAAEVGRTGTKFGSLTAHPKWRGGVRMKRGYRFVYAPDSPMCPEGDLYVAEHRLVASEDLGRPLTSDEHVHHINGVRNDNRSENLMVLSASEHQKIHPGAHSGSWAKRGGWERCRDCGTTDRPHVGNGRCKNCYESNRRQAQP